MSARRLSLALFALLVFMPGLARARVAKGQKAPGFSLPTLKGGNVGLSAYQGKVVVLDFWASWCEPCKKELPELEKLAREFSGKAAVLSVNIDKSRDNAERMVRQLGLSFDVALDPLGGVAATYDLPKMPSSFVVDKGGVVRFVHEGFEGPSDVERFRKELNELAR
jgi:peroxiredoxin